MLTIPNLTTNIDSQQVGRLPSWPPYNMLALDLGTTTGAAYLLAGQVVTETWPLTPHRHAHQGTRYVLFCEHLSRIPDMGVVVYEQVRRHAGTAAAHVYGGLLAHLLAACARADVPCVPAEVCEIKRYWTGHGKATKEDMIAEAHRRGYMVNNDNEADALALLHWAAAEAMDND